MVAKIYLKIILFICISLLIGCSKKEEYQTGELVPEEHTADSTSMLTIKPQPINYDSMLVVVSQLVDSIKNNPTNIELRQQLVAVSYDTTWETIISAGFGKPSQEAETESIALKYAERAATADALRWSAYIKRWSIDPTFPELGQLDVEIQGGRMVVKKVLPDQTVLVLIEIHSSKIL
ncbi:MAG: hypothetical protein JSW07_17500 [bacterium]|nr:MAG: hypothetical protein JSW07_17500 [bacterium]